MTAITITATDVQPVDIVKQFTGPAAESISAGWRVRLDATTGKITPANASASGEIGNRRGMALTTADPNEAVTVMEEGVVDVGEALADLNFDAAVYVGDTDGAYGTTAGTVTEVGGYVTPGWAATTADKLLRVVGL